MKATRRGWRYRRKNVPAPPVLAGMWLWREQYIESLRTRNYSPDTIRTQGQDLRRFMIWCDERSLTEPTEVTQPIIERFQRWLYYFRRPDGRPLGFRSQHHMLCSVRYFFRWLTRQHVTLFNPAAEIELPRFAQRLPREILTAAEVEAVLAQPDIETALGLRDRAMLETLYSTGIRRKELANLALYDLDPARGTLMVREGKHKKDRVLPIGQRAHAWIQKYLIEARPACVVEPDETHLFLTVDGGPFRRLALLSGIVNKYLRAADISKKGGCHVFRHTMATLMLENGADIRFIQEMLGHSRLSTTDVYTHVSIAKLAQIHHATHPAERPVPPAQADSAELPADARELLEHLAADDDEPDESGDEGAVGPP